MRGDVDVAVDAHPVGHQVDSFGVERGALYTPRSTPNALRLVDDATLQPHDPYASLRIPSYRWYILSTFTMTLAAQIQGVVVSWQIYDVTRDPLSLGLIGLAEALPYIGVALFAGHVADRKDRRGVSLASLALLVLCSAALLSLSLAGSWGSAGHRGVWPFYSVIFPFRSTFAIKYFQDARGMSLEQAGIANSYVYLAAVFVTPVFGTAQPLRGVSGAIRRYDYTFSEGRTADWLPLVSLACGPAARPASSL